jgi:DNA-binding winged helix-turn-helix (wHTH) protein/tetratricopeptide (TPR) repeat protein
MYEMDLDTQELRNAGALVKLAPQPFKLLEMLVSNAGQIVTREEIEKELWGNETHVDFERGVHKCIGQIRNVLNDKSERPLYLETVPRKGYRFLAPVTSKNVVVTPKIRDSGPVSPETFDQYTKPVPGIHDPGASGPIAVSTSRVSGGQSAAAALASSAAVAKPASRAEQERASRPRRRLMAWLGIAAVAVAGGLFYWHSQKANALMERDTIILADFANSTGEAVFDDTLKQALRIQLEQSPFLILVPDQKVNATLKLAGRSAGDRLTPEVARDICQRIGSKAMMTASIAPLGSQYVIGIQAMNCNTGDVLAEGQEQAKNKEDVLKALDRVALQVRRKLGESLHTVQSFATPIEEASTPSLEALKAYSLGIKASRESGFGAALPYEERAIQLDPKFASAYYELGRSYQNLSEPARAKEYYTKAFELREHTSEQEKLLISGAYYYQVTGELEKAAQIYEQLVDDYPRLYTGYAPLSVMYGRLGRYDKAIEFSRRGAELPPERVAQDDNLINFLIASQQLDQAREVVQKALKQKVDSYVTRFSLYALAFLTSDMPALTEQQQWFNSHTNFENFGLTLASDTEAYSGRLQKARQLSGRAVESAVNADNLEGAAMWAETQALREAAFGNFGAVPTPAATGLKLNSRSQSVQVGAALAFAFSGDSARAESMAKDLNESYPLGTQVQSLWLPAIRAQLALNGKNPAEALDQLQRAAPPIEYGTSHVIPQNTCLYPTYIRGQAYLASGQGAAAAAEFQKILDHGGLVWNCWTGALARLGAARANAMQEKALQGADATAAHTRALAAYQGFLNLWKDADPDIPIYKEAKAEYERLTKPSEK